MRHTYAGITRALEFHYFHFEHLLQTFHDAAKEQPNAKGASSHVCAAGSG